MPSLLWLQTGACSGDSMSILNAEDPEIHELLNNYSVEMLWHPSLSLAKEGGLLKVISDIKSGKQELTVFCVEGSIIHGPNGTGNFDTFHGKAKKEIVAELAEKAFVVVAMGTCSSYGGIPASLSNPSESTGLQFTKKEPGGLFPPEWKSKSGYPVINISGCPAHPQTMTGVLLSILNGVTITLDKFNRPLDFYNLDVHQGCTRNEYHEFNVEESEFGKEGCMFFNMGCQGPYTSASCNQILWNKRNSKTRAGVPCFGCTKADFPQDKNMFTTNKIGTIPVDLPVGVKRPNYMAYKGLARAATPDHLKNRKNKV